MSPTLNDVRLWAEAHDDDRHARYELVKVPARLGLHDDDLGLLPADLAHFEATVAPSGYGVVPRAADLDGARTAVCRRR